MAEYKGERQELMTAQLGIWFAHQASSDSSIYNVAEYLEISGKLDVGLFGAALRHTINEVDSYHLRFTEDGESVWQYVDKSDDWPLHFVDVSSTADPRVAAEDWMRADMRRPTDLRAGPLFTQALFLVAENRLFWYNRCHHIGLDGFTGAIIVGRLAEVYASLLEHGIPGGEPLAPISLLISADSSYRASDDSARDRDFWRDVLSNLPDVVSISGRRAARMRLAPMRYWEDIDRGAAAELRATARRLTTNIAGLMIAAAAILLQRSTGSEDIVIGLPVHGRVGKLRRRIPGVASNIVPIRLTVDGMISLPDLVRQISTQIHGALRRQRYHNLDIRRELNLVDHALFGMIVNVMPYNYGMLFGDCEATTYNLSNGPVNDISVAIYDRMTDGSMQIAFDLNPDLYRQGSGRDIAGHFMNIVRWLAVASPADQVRHAEVLSAGEWQQVVRGWNDTRLTVPGVGGVHELVRTQVAEVPDAVAVVYGAECVTYAGLWERAGRVAGVLAAAGAGPESVVGVCLPAGPAMVATILAVWQAGAAYLPLDPSQPAERLAFMLADSGAAVVVSHRAIARGLAGQVIWLSLIHI